VLGACPASDGDDDGVSQPGSGGNSSSSSDAGQHDAGAIPHDGSGGASSSSDGGAQHTKPDAATPPAADASTTESDAGDMPALCKLPAQSGTCKAYFPRYHHDATSGTCERFIYGGCDGNENNFETLAACEQACNVTPRSESCAVDVTDASLPGVRVHLEGDRCRVQTDRHHVFRYRIEVDDAIPYTAADSAGGCGRCGGYTDDPLTLVDIRVDDGNAVQYCQCDVGCCPPITEHEVTLRAGDADGELDWPGRQWQGPSDTNQPLGAPFPPGDYHVRLTFSVPGVGKISAALPIEVFAPAVASGEAACKVDGDVYPSGSTGVPDPASCNTCSCDDGLVTACTEIACPEPCPQGSVLATSCASCGPTDACEVVEYGCRPECEQGGDECTTLGGLCLDGVCRSVCG